MGQPFRTDQVVEAPYFADRDEETNKLLRVMRNRERIVLYGERRQGKSSVITRAARRLESEGGVVIMIDAWKVEDLNGINRAILKAVPFGWVKGTRLELLIRAFRGVVGLMPNEEGRPVLGLVGLSAHRDPHPDETLERILKGLNDVAGESKTPVVVVIDEFQNLEKIRTNGGALLRSIVQETGHLSYVFAGSMVGLVMNLIGPKGPFHGIERIEIGEIRADYLATWIQERSKSCGVEWTSDASPFLVAKAGPVTEYILRLAKAVHWIGTQSKGAVMPDTIDQAFAEIVADMDGTFDLIWSKMSNTRRKVLRGIADGEVRLTTDHFLSRYHLGSSSAASRGERELRDDGILAPGKPPRISDPFFAEWISKHGEIPLPLGMGRDSRPACAGSGTLSGLVR